MNKERPNVKVSVPVLTRGDNPETITAGGNEAPSPTPSQGRSVHVVQLPKRAYMTAPSSREDR